MSGDLIHQTMRRAQKTKALRVVLAHLTLEAERRTVGAVFGASVQVAPAQEQSAFFSGLLATMAFTTKAISRSNVSSRQRCLSGSSNTEQRTLTGCLSALVCSLLLRRWRIVEAAVRV